jgi:hypothetical protein
MLSAYSRQRCPPICANRVRFPRARALAEAIGAKCDLFVTSDTDFAALFGQRIKGVLIEKSPDYALRILRD